MANIPMANTHRGENTNAMTTAPMMNPTAMRLCTLNLSVAALSGNGCCDVRSVWLEAVVEDAGAAEESGGGEAEEVELTTGIMGSGEEGGVAGRGSDVDRSERLEGSPFEEGDDGRGGKYSEAFELSVPNPSALGLLSD